MLRRGTRVKNGDFIFVKSVVKSAGVAPTYEFHISVRRRDMDHDESIDSIWFGLEELYPPVQDHSKRMGTPSN